MKPSTEKRLFLYAWQFKRGIALGIVFLMLATALELAGPFIAKRIIDEHILGIEAVWYEVDEPKKEQTASYDGTFYVREDRLEGATSGKAITILAIGRDFYAVRGIAPKEGERFFQDGTFVIEADETYEFPAEKLDAKALYPFFKSEYKPIFMLLVLYVGLLVAASVFKFFETFKLQQASNMIVKKMRNDVFRHTQTIPIQYYVDQPAGKIVARITNDTEAIRDLYERVLSIVITRAIYMAGILIAIYLLQPKIALIALLIVPLIFVWAWVYKFFGAKYNLAIRKANSEINGTINESIQGMSIIQAFQVEKQRKARFEQLNEEIYAYNKKLIALNALTSFNLVTFIRNMTFVLFIIYFGNLSFEPDNVISIGMLYALVDYFTRFFEPVTAIVNQFPLIEQARASGNRMFALMDIEGKALDDAKTDRFKGEIHFKNVSFAYKGEDYVLKDISFDIKPGETVAFVGHTGSGKSSIMNLLFRFYDPNRGQIFIDGKPIDEMSPQQVRMHMGIVLQDPLLFTGTIISNVTMNNPNISRKRAIAALKAVGADRFIEKLPKRYDEPVTEGGTTFSLGERQLISFARALAYDPAILILDEATANIDTESEKVIQDALEVIQKDRTTLIIAHRLSTIQHADNIFVLENGKIKETGTHDELLALRGIYYQMYQMQKNLTESVS